LGGKDIGIRKSEFVATTQFLCDLLVSLIGDLGGPAPFDNTGA